jgi:nucleoside-diphosphate-sugar epimerase
MTILKFAEAVLELAHSESEIIFLDPTDDRITDDPKVRRPDIKRAQKTLGWEPEIHLADGLTRTIEYFSNRVR